MKRGRENCYFKTERDRFKVNAPIPPLYPALDLMYITILADLMAFACLYPVYLRAVRRRDAAESEMGVGTESGIKMERVIGMEKEETRSVWKPAPSRPVW